MALRGGGWSEYGIEWFPEYEYKIAAWDEADVGEKDGENDEYEDGSVEYCT